MSTTGGCWQGAVAAERWLATLAASDEDEMETGAKILVPM